MHWLDILQFPQLVEQLADLDLRLDALSEACGASGSPDEIGLLDEQDSVVGEGFFRCQHYMIARKGDKLRMRTRTNVDRVTGRSTSPRW